MNPKHALWQRMGKFFVEREHLEALPDWLQQMMHRVIVLRAEPRIDYIDGVEYTALCPEFGCIHNPQGIGTMPRVYRGLIEDGRFLRFES